MLTQLWYVLAVEEDAVRHLMVISLITLGLFGMLWFGIVVLDLSAGDTTIASALTILLVGLGVALTTGAFKRQPPPE